MTDVQATSRHHDAATGAGDVVLDDGRVVAYDAAAFAAGGLRLLRAGQRVRLVLAESGAVVAVGLVTDPA